MKLATLILLLFTAGLSPLNGQTPVFIEDSNFQDAAKSAIDSLYNRNPEATYRILSPWKEDNPDHPVWSLIEAMEFWWIVLTDLYDESLDERFFELMSKADQQADKLLEKEPDHPDAWIVKAVALGYTARHKSNRNRWVSSILTARKANSAHNRLAEVAPDLADNLLAEGLKKYYTAYLPEAYPVTRAVMWMLPSGDKQEGLELLEETSREAIFARAEAHYFLGTIRLNYEKKYSKARNHFEQLVADYPDNSFYRRQLVRVYYHLGKNYLVRETVNSALRNWEEKELDNYHVMKEELLYWKGRALLRTGHTREAHKLFSESFELGYQLPNTSGRSFHVLSGYYAGISAEWLEEPSEAINFYRAIAELDAEPDVRKNARDRIRAL